jgi:hypothetical protein
MGASLCSGGLRESEIVLSGRKATTFVPLAKEKKESLEQKFKKMLERIEYPNKDIVVNSFAY